MRSHNLCKTLVTSLMVLGTGVMSLPSHAQGAPEDGPRARPVPSAEAIARFEQEHARRQQALHDKLNITAAQEGAWATYRKAMDIKPMPPKEEAATLTTPERLERELAHMKERQTHLVDRIAATKALYAVLTPEQQQAFDAHHAHGPRPHGKKPRPGVGPKDGPLKD